MLAFRNLKNSGMRPSKENRFSDYLETRPFCLYSTFKKEKAMNLYDRPLLSQNPQMVFKIDLKTIRLGINLITLNRTECSLVEIY